MTCPALLMRNITDDPKWTSSIYHDHVSWFPGGSYAVEKLFRENYAERFLASSSGVFHNVPDHKLLFDKISTAIPTEWMPGSVDAVATASADGRRIVIKAVNYQAQRNVLLVRLQGVAVPNEALATLHTITAGLLEVASFEHPDAIKVVSRPLQFEKEFSLDLEPYTVAVIEIRAD